jgi:phosphoglycolate phosphatase
MADSYSLKVSAIALDLDGTLIDSVPDLAAAVNATLTGLQRDPLPVSQVRGFIGRGILHLLRAALQQATGEEPGAELLASARAEFALHYSAAVFRASRVYPGVVAGLEALHAAGFPLVCITNKASQFTLPLLAQAGLAPWFELVISGDTLPVQKPDPGPLLHAAAQLAMPPERLLLIGDSFHDLHAARAAGCPMIAVSYGYTDDPARLAAEADASVTSLADVAARLQRVA